MNWNSSLVDGADSRAPTPRVMSESTQINLVQETLARSLERALHKEEGEKKNFLHSSYIL